MFKTILSISWMHKGYKSGKFDDLKYSPCSFSSRFLRNHRLRLVENDGKWLIQQESNREGPLIAIPHETKVLFPFVVADEQFQGKWDVQDYRPSKEIIILKDNKVLVVNKYLSNELAPNDFPEFDMLSNTLFVGSPISVHGLCEITFDGRDRSFAFTSPKYVWEYIVVGKYHKELEGVELISDGDKVRFDKELALIKGVQCAIFTSKMAIDLSENYSFKVHLLHDGRRLKSSLPYPPLKQFAFSQSRLNEKCLVEYINI